MQEAVRPPEGEESPDCIEQGTECKLRQETAGVQG